MTDSTLGNKSNNELLLQYQYSSECKLLLLHPITYIYSDYASKRYCDIRIKYHYVW